MKKPIIEFFDTYCLLVPMIELVYMLYTYICGITWSIAVANAIFLHTFYILVIIYIILYLIFKYKK